MPHFSAVCVTDAPARALLTAYFAERADSFPAAQGRYRPAFPVSSQFAPPEGVFLLLQGVAGDEFLGCGGIRHLPGPGETAGRYELKHLWLHPSARGRGWGRLLLAELEARAVGLGATELVLDTNASLTAAGALYVSAGYVPTEPYNDNPNATTWLHKAL
ncbi:MAG: GNAT family N-acetyltransferase [Cryobacterium sp.]